MKILTYKNNIVGIMVAITGFLLFLITGNILFRSKPPVPIDIVLGVSLNLIGIIIVFVGLWLRPYKKNELLDQDLNGQIKKEENITRRRS